MSEEYRTDEEKRKDREAGRALVLARRPGGGLMVELRSVGDISDMARIMAATGIGVRHAFRNNVGACFRVCWQAMAWSMDPFAVAAKAYVVKNQRGEEEVSYEAQLIHAAINGSGLLEGPLEEPEYEGIGQDMSCLVTGTLAGGHVRTYHSPPIRNIRVKNSPLWQSDPELQLWYFSARNWSRKWAPDVILGVYSPDEWETGSLVDGGMIDGQAVEVPPERPQPEQFRASTKARKEAWSGPQTAQAQQTPQEEPIPPQPQQEPPPEKPEEPEEPEEEPETEEAQSEEYEFDEPRFTLIDAEGNEFRCNEDMSAIDLMTRIMSEAAARGQHVLEGVWETNWAGLEAELGPNGLAKMGEVYDSLLTRAAPQPEPEPEPEPAPAPKTRAPRTRQRAAPAAAPDLLDNPPAPAPFADSPAPAAEPGPTMAADAPLEVVLSVHPDGAGNGAEAPATPTAERLVWSNDARVNYVTADMALERLTARKARPEEYRVFAATHAVALQAIHDELGAWADGFFAKIEKGKAGTL